MFNLADSQTKLLTCHVDDFRWESIPVCDGAGLYTSVVLSEVLFKHNYNLDLFTNYSLFMLTTGMHII